jgi:hypothetical protein
MFFHPSQYFSEDLKVLPLLRLQPMFFEEPDYVSEFVEFSNSQFLPVAVVYHDFSSFEELL